MPISMLAMINKETLFKLMILIPISSLKYVINQSKLFNSFEFPILLPIHQDTTQHRDTQLLIDGYQILGLCQFQGTLDYIVGLNVNSNELHVMRFYNDTTTNQMKIRDYKKVDKDDIYKKLEGDIYVDCAYQSEYLNSNTYVIAIAGTYFHENEISSYYIAKFSTKYNFTEYFLLSEDQQTMEIVRGVKVDFDNQMIYLAVEINKQKYLNRTVYTPGSTPGTDNANVAIHGYSWTHGIRLWTSVIGDQVYQDSFARMSNWGNYLYVFLNSFTTTYTTNSSQTDIMYYRIRAQNGYVEYSKIFGSPNDDKVLDLQITFNGLYVLTLINNQLLPHKSNDRIWQTQSKTTNLAIILMDFDDDILDIEGYALSKITYPYPMKLLVPRTTDLNQIFILVGPRSDSDLNRGFYITYIYDSAALFVTTGVCTGEGCSKCSSQYYSKCLICKSDYNLFQHLCYAQNKCPDYSYVDYDSSGNKLTYCKSCHYSCKTCVGGRSDQCATCCQNNDCGAIKNREPNMGKCACESGTVDSNGLCLQRCVMNLAGKRDQMCYPQCPDNSYPELKYDQATSQERSQYDISSSTDCSESDYHLQFQKTGKGLPVNAPQNLIGLPEEFTIAFWIFPISLNTYSYFVNAFNRIYVRASGQTLYVNFQYKTGSTQYIEPLYTGDYRQKIVLNTWNYIAVSQREYEYLQILRYEQVLAISNSNMGVVNQAGYDYHQYAQTYHVHTDMIYIGSFNDKDPQSFTGYLKEFRLFTKYHGFAQLQDEQLRRYRYYSYDDSQLASYWKLSESHNTTDMEYTIYDYSINQDSMTYSYISKPDYPKFVLDTTNALTLCTFHDVKICRSLDYSQADPYIIDSKRLTQEPYFQIDDLSISKQDGDQIWFVANNTNCSSENILAYMQYDEYMTNYWVIPQSIKSPLTLKEGYHYQVCYNHSVENTVFNLFQVYLVSQPMTIDPSTNDAFLTDGVARTWGSVGGDQAYGDVIRFSKDCDYTYRTDYEMTRTIASSYGKHYTSSWSKAGDFYFCWQPTFVQELEFPYYHAAHDLRFRIVTVPTISSSAVTSVNANEDMVRFDLSGAFADGDMLAISWKGLVQSDCNPANLIGTTYYRNYSYWPSVWFGYETGIYGVKNYSMDELHLCYQSAATDAPKAWSRIKKASGSSYFVRVREYNQLPNSKCPELVTFYPLYGSSELYEGDTKIKFTFKSQAVYPSRQSDVGPIYGKIAIFRGAITPDGTIVRTSTTLWTNYILNDFATPDPFQQSELQCSSSGSCSIILSSSANKLKAGEIYYLSFFKSSFAYKTSSGTTTRYYLFNDKTLDTGKTTAYDHLFFCRSFNITASEQSISGSVFSINGTDLVYKSILSKELGGSVTTEVYYTKAINLKLTVKNTDSSYCTGNTPTATVSMENVYDTYLTVNNLDLKSCNTGMLYADIELVRGIRDQYGEFTHIRGETQKNIKLGNIQCDSSCSICNGTTAANCIICSNTKMFNLFGICYAQCPSIAPYYNQVSYIYQKKIFTSNYCLYNCPLGMYPDPITNQCLDCNTQCQTCSSQEIASCLTCQPIKYLYNGICIDDCPSPHFSNNIQSYTCEKVSTPSNLKIQIQSLGYRKKIPKDVQTYLKVGINNDNGGQILSIIWDQIEPTATSDKVYVFAATSTGESDTKASVVKLKMTAFNYMATSQVIKVNVTVYNSLGEVDNDIYEFWQNQPPVAGSTSLKQFNVNGNYCQNSNMKTQTICANGTTMDSIYMMNITGWSDTDSDLQYRVYIKVDQIYYTVTDLFSTNFAYFKMPLFSDVYYIKNMSICVAAVDSYDAFTYSCSILYNVENNLDYKSNHTKLYLHLSKLNYTKNMTNVIYAANALYWAMDKPKRNPSSPGLCTMDSHCNNNGECTSLTGSQKCICDLGFSGTFCQFQSSQLPDFQNLTARIIIAVNQTIRSKYFITHQEIELFGNVLRGTLKDPDLVNDDYFETILQLLELIGNSSLYAHYPVISSVRTIYLDGFTAVINKLFHSYEVQRASPKTTALANGNTLDQQYSYQVSNSRRRILSANGPNNGFLIGGVGVKVANSKETTSSLGLYQQWARRIDVQLKAYIDYLITKLNPASNKYTYTSDAFELLVKSDFASAFKDQTIYINEKDVSWYLPSSIFDNVQGKASDKHEVKMKAMKYVANLFIFEKNPGAFAETNVTELTFYDGFGEHINVTFATGSNDYVATKSPYNKTQAYATELMRCMTWNDNLYSFVDDGMCAFNSIYSTIPCASCDDYTTINTTVALCRCKHLSRSAVVYQQTTSAYGKGPKVGVYSDFFAMQYWKSSFGFYLIIVGSVFYAVILIIMIFIDRKTEPLLIAKIRERVRKLELKGFRQKEKKTLSVKRNMDGEIIFKRNIHIDEELKKEEDKKVQDQYNKAMAADQEIEVSKVQKLKPLDEKPKKGGKKSLGNKKKFRDDDNVQEAELLQPKGKKVPSKLLGKKKKAKKGVASELDNNQFNEDKQETQIADEEISPDRLNKSKKGLLDEELAEEEKQLKDIDLFEQQMQARYEEEKEIQAFVQKYGTSSSEEDRLEKDRSKDQKRYLKLERRMKEIKWFNWKNLLINGNYVTSILFVSSFLYPRHVRWTLAFTCVLLNLFWCAVIYNNTKDPLALPNFDQDASSLASEDMWIPVFSPVGTIILMYVFAGIFKLSDSRIEQSFTMIYLEQMLVELKKEMKLRFIIAYMISAAVYAAIFWYVVKFSAEFGWQVSWVWWYSCCFAIFFQFVIIDNLISLTHWVVYYCSRTLAQFWMKIRILKQAKPEA